MGGYWERASVYVDAARAAHDAVRRARASGDENDLAIAELAVDHANSLRARLAWDFTCAECADTWTDPDERWRLVRVQLDDDPVELLMFCDNCGARELDAD